MGALFLLLSSTRSTLLPFLFPLPSLLNRQSHSSHAPSLPILTARLESDKYADSELPQIHARFLRTDALPNSPTFHWNCLMRAYLRRSSPLKSLHLFTLMCRCGRLPDHYTLPIILKAASHLYAPILARQLHTVALKFGLESDKFCESGLLTVYGKNWEFNNARKLFDEIPDRRLGAWNAIMSGLAQAGRSEEVVGLFVDLGRGGGRPDDVTMLSVLSACGSLGNLQLGAQLHKCAIQAVDCGADNVLMWNSLVDMYGKCGRTDLAYQVFSRMLNRDVSTWTAMIMAFSMHGHVDAALRCFQEMRRDGVRPNYVTFLSVLSVCAHGGLVDEAVSFFEMMSEEFDIEPTLAHYGCMVDVLGRVGRLKDARRMVERMPMMASPVIFGTLLGACEKHGNVEVGKWAASWLSELEPWNDGVYVVLSNIYANSGMWEEVERVRGLMKELKITKMPSFSLPAVMT